MSQEANAQPNSCGYADVGQVSRRVNYVKTNAIRPRRSFTSVGSVSKPKSLKIIPDQEPYELETLMYGFEVEVRSRNAPIDYNNSQSVAICLNLKVSLKDTNIGWRKPRKT